MTVATAHPLLYSHLGHPTRTWTYRDAEGRAVGAVARWDRRDGGKDVRPAARIEGGWTEAAMPTPRPLYRLPDLLADSERTVLVVEGEKAADAALGALGTEVAVTTWAGGCGAVARADWGPLQGRYVRVWPDADEPGARAARKVVAHAHVVGAVRIHRLRVPSDWPKGHDAADLLTEDVRALWGDAARWPEVDVRAALARYHARSVKRAPRLRRPNSLALDLDAARAVSVLEVARRIGCGAPVKRGRETAVRCPFHEDRKPSLRIATDGRRWFCDPCAEGGDAIRLYMRARRLDFADAVRELTR